jgi:hypothetical protein
MPIVLQSSSTNTSSPIHPALPPSYKKPNVSLADPRLRFSNSPITSLRVIDDPRLRFSNSQILDKKNIV